MSGWRHWLSSLVGLGRGGSVTLSEPPPSDYGPDDVRPAPGWDADLDLTLGKLVTETETRASGRVQILTVAHLRASLGDGWQRYKSRVILIAETTIGRMIGKGNTFIAQDEDSWLLLMPALSEREAELKADDIARVLGEKLVGERFAEKEPPLPQTAKVDLGGALNPDGSFNTTAMKAAVKRARLALAAKDAHLATQRLDGMKGSIPRKEKAIGTAAAFAQASLFPTLTLVYRPLWVAETESVASFALRAFTDTGEPLFGPNAPPDVQAALNDATFIDLAKAAFSDFSALAPKGLRATFVLPVPFSVMTRQLGAVFLRALAALPQKERLMHLRVELVNVPPSTSVEKLIDVREVFRGRVKDVAYLTELAAPSDAVLSLDHVVIGAECRGATLTADADVAHALSVFRRRSAARRAYVMGLRSRAQVAAAVQCGLDEVSGPGLLDDVRHLPDRLSVIYRQDLVRGG